MYENGNNTASVQYTQHQHCAGIFTCFTYAAVGEGHGAPDVDWPWTFFKSLALGVGGGGGSQRSNRMRLNDHLLPTFYKHHLLSHPFSIPDGWFVCVGGAVSSPAALNCLRMSPANLPF
jgi:hypothetical protein